MSTLFVRIAVLTAAIGWAAAVTDYQHTCDDASAVYQRVGCCGPDGTGYATNTLDAMQQVRIAYYEHLRENTDYICRVYNPRMKNSVNGSDVLPFLATTNRAILRDEAYSVINDWWYDVSTKQFMEIQFYDTRTVNMSMTTSITFGVDPWYAGNWYDIMEHFSNLNKIGFSTIGTFFDTTETTFGSQNLRMSKLKTPEEVHLFEYFQNLTTVSPGLGHTDLSTVSFAELLGEYKWLLLN
jgi:uncharacterized protein YchJ